MKAKYKAGDIVMFQVDGGVLRGKVDSEVVVAPKTPGSTQATFGYWIQHQYAFSVSSTITYFVMEDRILGMETEPAAPLTASACTCGARATGSPGHSSWCDTKEIA